MQLTMLACVYFMCAVGDDEGKIYTLPWEELKDVEIVAPVPWHSKRVRLPQELQEMERHQYGLVTREVTLEPRLIPEINMPVVCGFDPLTKTWYVYED